MGVLRRGVIGAVVVGLATAGIAGMGGSAHAVDTASVFRDGPRLGIKSQHAVHDTTPVPLELQSTQKQAVDVHPKVYVVFWGKQWATDTAKAKSALPAFFAHLYGSTETWGKTLTQYCQGLAVGTINCGSAGQHVVHPSANPLGGVFADTAANAPANATKAQIAAEAAKAAVHFGNTTQASNTNTQYVIASPHGTHPDGFPKSGFCGWHSAATTASGTIAYTNLPYIPDLGVGGCTVISAPTVLDGYFSTESHEYAETVTDFWVPRGWADADGKEIADKCQDFDRRETLGGTAYDVQGIWSNLAMACKN